MLMKSRIWILLGFLLLAPFPGGAAEYDAGVKGNILLQTEKMSNGELIDYRDSEHPVVTVMTVEIAPGSETGWHSHSINVYAYVLSGQMKVEIEGGKTAEFKEGEVIIEVVNLRHNGVNKGKIPVKLLVFYLGEKGVPNVIRAKKP